MGLGASGWLLDIGEKIGVASVYEEGEGEVSLGSCEAMGWKGGCEKLVGLGSESTKFLRFSKFYYVWLFYTLIICVVNVWLVV